MLQVWKAIISALMLFGIGLNGAADAKTPLRVLLIPADGGTEDGTKADFKPLFDALATATGLEFDIRVGQSYAAVIEGMCAGHADIAWFGPVSFVTARDRGCAELLAVEARGNSTSYHAALFVRAESDILKVGDLKGRSLALGSSHSASSFAYPLAILKSGGVDPVKDIARLSLFESHSQGLMALSLGRVDASGASLISFERAINQGGLDPAAFRILARSGPIPNPPLAISTRLPDDLKEKLQQALSTLHETEGIAPGAIRGYGGKPVDRYVTGYNDADLSASTDLIAFIDDDLRAALLRKAGKAAQR